MMLDGATLALSAAGDKGSHFSMSDHMCMGSPPCSSLQSLEVKRAASRPNILIIHHHIRHTILLKVNQHLNELSFTHHGSHCYSENKDAVSNTAILLSIYLRSMKLP